MIEGSRATAAADGADYFRRHLTFGWWALLCFLTLGVVLETLHGFKVRWYLDVGHETRRLMWTLAHAHGTLLSLVHIAFGVTARWTPAPPGRIRVASRCLIAASFLLPGGFFLGGLFVHGGDPGIGVLLVPLGALALLGGVLLTAWSVAARTRPTGD